jgi:hypothetical protein
MISCTYDMPRSACSVALETYHGASTTILRILDWLLWVIDYWCKILHSIAKWYEVVLLFVSRQSRARSFVCRLSPFCVASCPFRSYPHNEVFFVTLLLAIRIT